MTSLLEVSNPVFITPILANRTLFYAKALQYSCSLDPNAKRSLFLQEKVHLLRQMDDLQRDIDHKIRQYASNFSDISTESTQVRMFHHIVSSLY